MPYNWILNHLVLLILSSCPCHTEFAIGYLFPWALFLSQTRISSIAYHNLLIALSKDSQYWFAPWKVKFPEVFLKPGSLWARFILYTYFGKHEQVFRNQSMTFLGIQRPVWEIIAACSSEKLSGRYPSKPSVFLGFLLLQPNTMTKQQVGEETVY